MEIIKNTVLELIKQEYSYIEDHAAAYFQRTKLAPDQVRLVQKQKLTDSGVTLTSWFEPLGHEEAELYRRRAEAAEAENKRLIAERDEARRLAKWAISSCYEARAECTELDGLVDKAIKTHTYTYYLNVGRRLEGFKTK